ncbi:hypothetical protein SAMN05444673_4367 [Bacillus sp. OV166]|uniref:hypothetical protein n=1 Tax=Bacillus sp. OV166 TaxID=1882763 RepID=UPI000A2AC59B|nr:hypothetical protein [Bacillus sp. OV166]SMQ81536.1 hypothetical protein SAMN05444673_4367 [Bacillus sp. OV166]
MKTFEALEWLTTNKNPSALASDRFGETANAIKFVEKLYELGALKVNVIGILDESERIEEEGGPYVTSLTVDLPPDNEKRDKLIKFYKKEMEEQGIEAGEGILEWNGTKMNEGKLGFGWG